MTSVDMIGRLFKVARDSHTKIDGIPYDENVISFKEALFSMCLQIAFDGTDAGDPSGVILEDAHY